VEVVALVVVTNDAKGVGRTSGRTGLRAGKLNDTGVFALTPSLAGVNACEPVASCDDGVTAGMGVKRDIGDDWWDRNANLTCPEFLTF
jgi:hypothetical protein